MGVARVAAVAEEEKVAVAGKVVAVIPVGKAGVGGVVVVVAVEGGDHVVEALASDGNNLKAQQQQHVLEGNKE